MRDTNGAGKFEELINEFELVSSEIPKRLEKNKDEMRRMMLRAFLLSTKIKQTIAHYSLGSDKETVKLAMLDTIYAFEEGFKWEGFEKSYGAYDEMIWMVSLGILLDLGPVSFKHITDILHRDEVNDKLLNYLIKSKQPEWQRNGGPIIQKSPYSGLEKAIAETDAVKGIAIIKTYLEKEWYKGHADAAWHDSHKNTKVNTYFGYWAWETAALVKAKGWDDTALQGVLYYPYDAVHW